MKGNITISKKSALLIASVIGIFTMADYVSLINTKSIGGVIVDGATEEEIQEAISATMPIGSVSLRMDSIDPTTIYGGTWELITGDASLGFGDGSSYSGVSNGVSNDPVVPLPYHDHTINHDHPAVSTSTNGNHTHDYYRSDFANTNNGRASLANDGPNQKYATSASGNHNHTVNIPNYNGVSGGQGTSNDPNPTLNVRGARIMVNVWKRTL